MEEKDELRCSRAAVVESIEVKVEGVGDSIRFLYGDDGCGCGADAVLRLANGGCEELCVVGDDVFEGGQVNVAGQGGQGLKGWRLADGSEIDFWDELGKRGGNVRWPILFIGVEVRPRSVFEDEVREAVSAFSRSSIDGDDDDGEKDRNVGQEERNEGDEHGSLNYARLSSSI